MKPHRQGPTGRLGARSDAPAGRGAARKARRSANVALALVSWVVALGCQTASPSAAPARPSSTPPAPFPLAGISWRADEIEDQRVADRVAATLAFDGTARAVGSTGCNRYVAPLDVTGAGALSCASLAVGRAR